MKKKMNNKGFSLVELIIVIAIMAVLMVVLAPQFLKYVEKSRLQKDNSAISEITNAIEIACADEKILDAIPIAGTSFTFTGAAGANKVCSFTGTDALSEELKEVVGEVTTSSTTYKDATAGVKINVTNVSGVVTITLDNFYSDTKTKEDDGYKIK